jgi:tetratricopeptide (TPR) repeat protein
VMDGIEKLEEALDRAINTVLIHKRIATGYEKIQDNDKASEHYHAVGNLEADAGRIDKAMENYRKAMTLSPQNLAAHESLIRRLQDAGEDGKAMEEIGALARKLFGFGFADRAYEALRGIISKATHLLDVRLLFADVLHALGRKSEAVKEYMGVVAEKKRTGSLEGIEEIYHKILTLDPTNREARFGLSREQIRRVGRWVVWVHRVSAAAALALLGLWGLGEILARNAWAREEQPARRLASEGNCEEALAKVREIGSSYPASLLSASLAQVEKGLFKEAFYRQEEEMGKAFGLRKEGKFEDARRTFQDVRKAALVEAQAQRALQGIKDLEAIQNASADLVKSAEFFIKAGSYEDAFVFCRKVIDQYPEAIRNLRIPLYIRSEPPGAAVHVNGTLWGHTPLWIIVSMKGRQDLRLEMPGHAPQTVQGITNRRTPTVNVTLRKVDS